MSLALYRTATWAAGPLIRRYLERRLAAGREDAARMPERLGEASRRRPDGPLIWIHAASVGESLSMLTLIERLRRERSEISILMTSGTVTSAQLLGERLPDGVIHQYVPVDRMAWARRFLDHWRPDLVLWVESEFWPNMLCEVHARGIPSLLVNARISARSWRGWRRAPWIIRRLLNTFDLCMAQTDLDAERLRDLGSERVACPGNLKFAADPLPADAEAMAALEASTFSRPRWLVFSTHRGEEELIAEAHSLIARNIPDLLTIVVPRHPTRGEEVTEIFRARGLTVARRSLKEPMARDTAILVGDTMGELGLFFRVTDIAFVGGTLVPHGGQNPIEPARLGCAILHGPHMENFLAIEAEMLAAGAAETAATPIEIARAVGHLLTSPEARQERIAAARDVAEGKFSILDAAFSYLAPYLDRIASRYRAPDRHDARA